MTHQVEQHGFSVAPGAIGSGEQRELLSILGPLSGAGRRGLLDVPAVAEFARSRRLCELIQPHIPSPPFAVRAIYSDKSPETNWLVPWHQDLTLAPRARAEVPGFGPWSTKGWDPTRAAAR